MDTNEITLEEGESGKINASFTPVYATDDTKLLFTSSHPSILKVEADGSFVTYSHGVVTVTIENSDGSFSTTVTVTVKANAPANPDAGITLEQSEFTLHITGNKTATIKAIVTPEYANDDITLHFESEDSSIATVDQNGVITAKSAGVVTITIRCGRLSTTCKVTVTGITVGNDTDTGYGDFIPYT